MLHPNFHTGQPCSCLWGRADTGHSKVSGEFFDEIKNRKKLQTPDAQALLRHLEREGYVTDFTEKWVPWLLNRVKEGGPDVPRGLYWHNDGTASNQSGLYVNGNARDRLLYPEWQHWCDWLNSGHGTRRTAGDPEKLSPDDIRQNVKAWDEDLANQEKEAVRGTGTPIYQHPNGWTIRELGPDEVGEEGKAMGHCVGSYGQTVRDGRLRVLSLRDPNGDPHVTTGIYSPTAFRNGDNGHIYQHYGKGNQDPKPEYNDIYKSYFDTIPMHERPLADEPSDDDEIYDFEDAHNWLEKNHPAWQLDEKPKEGPKLSELGLPYEPVDGKPRTPSFDPDHLHNAMVVHYNREPWFKPEHADTLYELLREYGDIPKYVNETLQPAEEAFYDKFYQNYEPYEPPYSSKHWEPYPGYHPDTWEEPDWKTWFDKTKQQDTPENRANTAEEYEEDEGNQQTEWMNEWPEYQAINAMRDHLAPHYNPQMGQWSQKPYKATAKTANTFHYHPTWGHECRCPWGGGERNMEFVGAKADWLRGRKDLQDQPGQEFLTFLEELDYPDKLMPWIIREWRKGRVTWDGKRPWLIGNMGQPFTPQQASEWMETAEGMKKYKKGIDFMQHDFSELRQKMNEARQFLNEKQRKDFGEVLHRFDNGWTVRRLQNANEARVEGDDMGHCVGSYGREITTGDTNIISLRDPNNMPHGTMELAPGQRDEDGRALIPGSEVSQWFGNSNTTPKQEYTDMMNEYLATQGIDPAEPMDQWWDDEYQAYPVESFRDYIHYVNDGADEFAPDEYHQAYSDAEENGMHEPELLEPEVQYHNIINGIFNSKGERRWENWEEHVKPRMQEFWDSAYERGDMHDFYDAWKEHHQLNEGDVDPEVNDVFKEEFSKHLHPETGQFQNPVWRYQRPGEGPASHWETAQDQWWNQNKENYPQIPGYDWGEQNMPSWAAPQILAHIAARIPALYYRWSFCPDTGQIEFSHNHSGHPAEVDYHRDLTNKINRPNLVHGYAYRLPDGWRITDWEHRPVEDPFILARVHRSLEPQDQPPDWQNDEPDWSRSHYGLPI